jgi:hypothetical protein
MNISNKPELQLKITWRMQFIKEAIEFSEEKMKEPYKTLATGSKGVIL